MTPSGPKISANPGCFVGRPLRLTASCTVILENCHRSLLFLLPEQYYTHDQGAELSYLAKACHLWVIWICIPCIQLVSMNLVKTRSLQKWLVLDAVKSNAWRKIRNGFIKINSFSTFPPAPPPSDH